MLSKKLPLCLLGAALAATVFTTGCRGHHKGDRGEDTQPAAQTQAAPSEATIYSRWEAATNREHRALEQRAAAEQSEYREWRQSHPDGR